MLPLIALALSSQVWIVDDSGGPGVDFTDLPAAVAAASAGDVLLVRSGTYSTATVTKGLTLQADEGASVRVPGLRVELVPAGEHVTLSGLDSTDVLWLEGCDGTVWIQDCFVDPPGAANSSDDGSAIEVLDCVDVVLLDTVGVGREIAPGASGLSGATPTSGLHTTGSSVHVFSSTFSGGSGAFLENPFGGFPIELDPAPGAHHVSGEFVALDSTFQGGQGHSPHHPYFGGCQESKGGPGVRLDDKSHVRDCQLLGGPGGVSLFGICPQGETGDPFVGIPPVEHVGENVALGLASPLRENSAFDLTLDGSPGTIAVVVVGAAQNAEHVPVWEGSFVLQFPFVLLAPVVLPGTGTLNQSFPPISLGPAVESLTVFAQVAAVGPGGKITVNDVAAVVVLDDQF